MAASRSMTTARGLRIQPDGISFNNRATPTATGTASTMAMADVTNVPKMNGSAPKLSRPITGFQFRPIRKWIPNRERTLYPSVNSTARMSPRRTISPSPIPRDTPWNAPSPKRLRRRARFARSAFAVPRRSTMSVLVLKGSARNAGRGFHLLAVDGDLGELLKGLLREPAGQRRVVDRRRLALALRERPCPEIHQRLGLRLALLIRVDEHIRRAGDRVCTRGARVEDVRVRLDR